MAPLHTLHKGHPIRDKLLSKKGLGMGLDERKLEKIWNEKDKEKGEKNGMEGK